MLQYWYLAFLLTVLWPLLNRGIVSLVSPKPETLVRRKLWYFATWLVLLLPLLFAASGLSLPLVPIVSNLLPRSVIYILLIVAAVFVVIMLHLVRGVMDRSRIRTWSEIAWRFVGWAECNESHHPPALFLVGLVALGPPYVIFRTRDVISDQLLRR